MERDIEKSIDGRIAALHNLPPLKQQHCGTCEYFKCNHSYPTHSTCLAMGGRWSVYAWRACGGSLYAERKTFMRRFLDTINV